MSRFPPKLRPFNIISRGGGLTASHHVNTSSSRTAKRFLLYQELANQNLEEERKPLLPFIKRCWHRKEGRFVHKCSSSLNDELGTVLTSSWVAMTAERGKERGSGRQRERSGRTQDECLLQFPRSRAGVGRGEGGEDQSKGKGWSVHILSPVSCAKVHLSWCELCAKGLETHL